jgi:hypothetical protein
MAVVPPLYRRYQTHRSARGSAETFRESNKREREREREPRRDVTWL